MSPPHSPVFLEVKRRTTETIHKLRAAVSKQAAEKLLGGTRLKVADCFRPTKRLFEPLTSSAIAAKRCDWKARLMCVISAKRMYRTPPKPACDV